MIGDLQAARRRYTPRQNILFAFFVAILLILAWVAREVVILIYVSALLAVVIMPLVRIVQRIHYRKWTPNRGLSMMLILLFIILLATVFFAFAVPPMVEDMHNLIIEAPQHASKISERIHSLPILRHFGNFDLRGHVQLIASTAAGTILSSIPSLAHILLNIVTGLILIVYFVVEGEGTYQWLIRLVPRSSRDRLDHTLVRAELRMGKWLLGQGSLMLILGLCSLVVFWALHLRYFYALAMLMGIFNIIPVLGAVITVLLAMFVAALDSWTKVIGVMIFYAVYAQIEQAYLTPRIMKSSVDLAGAAVIVAFLFGTVYAGVIGALVAVPTAVLIVVLLEEYAMDEHPNAPVGTTNFLADRVE